MSTTTPVTDQSFQKDVLESAVPTLVDFWADWCAPCKQLAPILEDVSTQMDGRVRIVKMDIEENPHTPVKYGIRQIPTLLLFHNGELIAHKSGLRPKGELVAWIEESLGN